MSFQGAGSVAMNPIEIFLDGGLFTADVVARTAHRYTGAFFVEITSGQSGTTVRLTPKGLDEAESCQLPERFRNDALDERLRDRIRSETSELHTTLVQAALREAQPSLRGTST